MLSVREVVSVKVKGKDFEFTCDPQTSLPDALEATSQINAFLLGRQEQGKQAAEAQAKAAAEAAEQPAVVEVPEPEQA